MVRTRGKQLTGKVGLCLAGILALAGVARAQGAPHGFWTSADHDAAHSSWQTAETAITTETVTKDFKLLWKLKLGNSAGSTSFSEPLLFPGLITGKGFKDFVLWADANTLYAVDSELGALVWQKDFKLQSPSPCSSANLQIVIEPPQVIQFGAPRPAGPRPPPEPPVPPASRRVGGNAGGGHFGLKGIYIVTSDGYIHEQIMATGLDFAPPVKFFPVPGGSSLGLNIGDKVVYAAMASGCGHVANAVWSINLGNTSYPVSSYHSQKLIMAGLTGPAIGHDGTAYVVTGSGPEDQANGVYPNSVVALTAKELKVKDWYSAPAAGNQLNAGPVVFTYKGKEMIVAPGKDGSLVLLDSGSLGGPDHHTPLAESAKVFKTGKHGEWESLATWRDKGGVSWVFASTAGPVLSNVKIDSNGPAKHGSIVAFKVEEKDGHTVLTPSWISRDLINPAPPAIANGVVLALAGGNPSNHATLYAFDAASGKLLYASGDAVQTYTHLAGMSVGDGHVFFTTHDNTLYSFGIPLEH